MNTLRNVIETQYKDNIEIRCGQTVTKLLHNVDADGSKMVTGVQVNGTTELKADAVILATGGFGCSSLSKDGLMARFRPDLIGTPTTNGAFAQGEGVSMGEEVGADLIDMDKVQLHPTGFINPKDPSNPTKILAPEAIRGCGGILVNNAGKRFVNELDLRSVVAAAIHKNCSNYKSGDYEGPPFAWCILSEPAQKSFGENALSFYKDSLGLFDACKGYKVRHV
jgi:succinate dehydrogenase/fumarate reductase flavoprotein subunit